MAKNILFHDGAVSIASHFSNIRSQHQLVSVGKLLSIAFNTPTDMPSSIPILFQLEAYSGVTYLNRSFNVGMADAT